ncbi:YigZ family protein [Caldanaerobacter sp.]|uniref:YigZ family protein n=1 Tax=Caldanaerobacter sp. TaxID=2930036 RepID=UPI003C72C4AB
MGKIYKTLLGYGVAEIEIKKSRFIGHASPVASEEEAIKFIEKIRSEHRLATHNVYAYVVGENDEVQRFSDDGEPSGTAGMPVLSVIKKEEVKNVVVVVTRYFGGILLGAGGLIRAYTKAAKMGIDAAGIVERIPAKEIELTFDYNLLGKVQNELLRKDYLIKNISYTDKVIMTLPVIENKVLEFENFIIDLTASRCEIRVKEDVYLFKKDGKYIL